MVEPKPTPNPLALHRESIDRYDRIIGAALLQRRNDLQNLARICPETKLDFLPELQREMGGMKNFGGCEKEAMLCLKRLYECGGGESANDGRGREVHPGCGKDDLAASVLGAERIILQAIGNRMFVSARIGAYKKANGMAILDPDRKNEIETKMRQRGLDDFLPFFEALHDLSVKIQT